MWFPEIFLNVSSCAPEDFGYGSNGGDDIFPELFKTAIKVSMRVEGLGIIL